MRVCQCGCGESLEGRDRRALYATAACRARGWKREYNYGPQPPPKVRTNARKQSGLQVSYRRAVLAMSIDLSLRGVLMEEAIEAAEASMRYILSDKQRARLDARREA